MTRYRGGEGNLGLNEAGLVSQLFSLEMNALRPTPSGRGGFQDYNHRNEANNAPLKGARSSCKTEPRDASPPGPQSLSASFCRLRTGGL